MTTSKNTRFTGGDRHVNKYLYFRVNNSNNISMYNICDVTVAGVINSLEQGRGSGQGGYLGLVTRGISQIDGLT